MKRLLALVFIAPAAFAQVSEGAADPIFKQIAAPATDILAGRVRLPEPSACATTSPAAQVPLEFAWSQEKGWQAETVLAIGSAGALSLAAVHAARDTWSVEVRDAHGEFTPIERAFGDVVIRAETLDDWLPGWGGERFDIPAVDSHSLSVRVRVTDANQSSPPNSGWLVARDGAPIAIAAYTSTLATLSENAIGILAHLFDTRQDGSNEALRGVATGGEVVVETTRGALRLELFDDGLHQDGAAEDGVFGAVLPRWTSGDVRALVELRGVTYEGRACARSVQVTFPMLERRTAFTGAVEAQLSSDGRLEFDLGAHPFGPASKLHVSAEVWGTNAAGELVPVCWLSRMALPTLRDGAWRLPLALDLGWLTFARANAPLYLRHLRVQDPDTHVPYDVVDWLAVPALPLPPTMGHGPGTITRAMLMTPVSSALMTPSLQEADRRPRPFGRLLMLVHGYCSNGMIWPPADFTAPKFEFVDANQNRTHDQFALLLRAAAPVRSSFGVVAHSQGGPAALHLYTYYASGLDIPIGPRRIQSVASPYQGTPLASWGGFACGVNNDMTPSGSTTWLAGIPTWARDDVWYWTTANSGSACNFITSLLLADPEDGTVEMTRGQLPGAHSMGHVTGWCHTTGMSNPANYTDHARNALINTNAAR